MFDIFKQQNIRAKLLIAFIVTAVMVLLSAAVGIMSLSNIRGAFSYTINYPRERYILLAEAKYRLESMHRDFILMAVPEEEGVTTQERLATSLHTADALIQNMQAAKAVLIEDRHLDASEKESLISTVDEIVFGVESFKDEHIIPFAQLIEEGEGTMSDILAELHTGLGTIEPYAEKLDGLIAAAEMRMRSTHDEADALAGQMLWYRVVFSVAALSMAAFLARYVIRTVSGPIGELVDITSNVADGKLNVNFDIKTSDETRVLAEKLKQVVDVISRIVQNLRGIDRAFRIDGDTTVRLDASHYKGAYAEVATAINNILEYHVSSKREILECISKIVDGENDAPLRKYPGLESHINKAVDSVRTGIRATEQMIKLKAEADAANREKSAFLANMSHEIRTPMNVILGATELLLEDGTLSADVTESLVRIHVSGNMLLSIVNDILDFSKIEAGKMELVPKNYNLANMINDAVQLLMMRFERGDVKFELYIDETIPLYLYGDELRIVQILNNLLSNAFKYTSSGWVTLSVTYRQPEDASEIGEKIILVLSVQDTGCGMTEEQLEILFDEYSQFNQEANKVFGGTGLGLTITRRLLDLMNGEIQVKSEYGRGSTFTAKIPQELVDNTVIGKKTAEVLCSLKMNLLSYKIREQLVRDSMSYGKVLVVDDMENNRYIAVGLLKPYKLRIDTVGSGQEAIDKIKSGEIYDVIFMDHMMPAMSGVEAAAYIRKLGYTAPIVALTANVVAGKESEFFDNGFDDFLSKPIDTRLLNTILTKYIRDRHPEEAAAEAGAAADKGEKKKKKLLLNKKIPGLDMLKGLTRYSYDKRVYLGVLNSYAKNIRDLLENLGTVPNEGEIDDYRIAVHGIKGSSREIYADKAADSAEKLEQAAKDRDFEYIALHHPPFLRLVRELVGDVEGYLRAEEEANPKPEKEKPDDELLSRLSSACKVYNMTEADEAMAAIEEFKYTGDGGLSGWLRETFDRMDFPAIVGRLEGADPVA